MISLQNYTVALSLSHNQHSSRESRITDQGFFAKESGMRWEEVGQITSFSHGLGGEIFCVSDPDIIVSIINMYFV